MHYYYIPMSKVEGWDGHVLWLKITEEEVKRKYERDLIPDPTRYYERLSCVQFGLLSRTYDDSIKIYQANISWYWYYFLFRPKLHQHLMYLPFLNAIFVAAEFKTEDDLSYHIRTMH